MVEIWFYLWFISTWLYRFVQCTKNSVSIYYYKSNCFMIAYHTQWRLSRQPAVVYSRSYCVLGLSVLEFKHCTATETLLRICVVITFLWEKNVKTANVYREICASAVNQFYSYTVDESYDCIIVLTVKVYNNTNSLN